MAAYNDKLERLNGDDNSRGAIVERLKAADEQLEKIKAEEQQQREKLTALQSQDAKKNEDIPALKEVRAPGPGPSGLQLISAALIFRDLVRHLHPEAHGGTGRCAFGPIYQALLITPPGVLLS